MFDARTEKNLATLDPVAQKKFRPFIQAAKEYVAKQGYDYILISGNRTWKEQDALYAQGRTKPGKIVTNAKGGQSNHNFGAAGDFGVFKDGKYLDDSKPAIADKIHREVGKIAKEHGIEWGGDWKTSKDYPHFEAPVNMTLAQKREAYSKHGTIFNLS